MDESDLATHYEELNLQAAMLSKKPELPRTGFCWWCSEPTNGAFCSSECQQDHEQQQRFTR